MIDVEASAPAFRLLTPADESFLWEMLYYAIHLPPGSPPAPRETVYLPELRRYVQGWGRPGDLGFAALASGRAVGAAWLRLFDRGAPGYGFVDESTPELSIALRPEYRGAGRGTALMERLIEASRPQTPAISLSVSPDNPARRLYERCGFRVVDRRGDSLVMLLNLSQA